MSEREGIIDFQAARDKVPKKADDLQICESLESRTVLRRKYACCDERLRLSKMQRLRGCI